MKPKKSKILGLTALTPKKVSGFIIILILALSFFSFKPIKKYFIIESVKEGKILFIHNYEPGMKFGISYIHSVNKSEIIEYFFLGNNDAIYLSSAIFSSFGAGVSSYPDEGLKPFLFEKDFIKYEDINRIIDDFVIFIGTEAEHTLLISSKEIKLNKIALPMANIRIRAGKLSLAKILFGVDSYGKKRRITQQ